MDDRKGYLDIFLDCDLSEVEIVESGDFIFIDAYFEDRGIESLVIEYVPTSKDIGVKEKHQCLYQKMEYDKAHSLLGKQQSGNSTYWVNNK